MTRRLTHIIRELTKARFGVSEENLSAAEEKSTLLLYPDGKGEFTGGYGLEFWSELQHKHIGIVFPVGCFEDDTDDDQEDEE